MDAMNGMNPAAEKRAMLADHYDNEVAQRLQLAQFASEAGLKSATSHLLNLAGKSRRFAAQAREREQLHGILAQVAASEGAQNPGNFFQQRMGMEPEPAMPDATASAGGGMPGYAGGTPNTNPLEMLKRALDVGGADQYTPIEGLQNRWNKGPSSIGQGIQEAPQRNPLMDLLHGYWPGQRPQPAAPAGGVTPDQNRMRQSGYVPGYADGTPNTNPLESLKMALGVGGADNYSSPGEMQSKWNAGPMGGVRSGWSTTMAHPTDARTALLDILNGYMPGQRPQTPGYAHGAPPGTHPGGPALVGEDGPEASSEGMLGMEGPEVRNLPPGATVAPNILTVIRMLLDIAEAGQGGDGAPESGGGGYAFGTGSINRMRGQMPGGGGMGGRGYTGSGTEFRPGDIQDPSGRFNANQGLQSLIEHGASAGAYDPLGSTQAADISRQAILSGMGGRQAAAGNMADIYAQGDPAFRAYARLKAQSDTQSQAAQAYEQARAAQVAAAQGFSRDILGSQFGATLRKDPAQPNPLAAIGGQVAGSLLGAAIPGAGVRKPAKSSGYDPYAGI